jgi:universal stress protein E
MKDLTSILVVMDRSARDAHLLTKALVMACELNARIELFSCDAEHEYALKRAYDRPGVEAARQNCLADLYDYLRRLSHLVTAQNVAVSVDVVCESPLYEGIVHKVLKSCPDLVMKAAASEQSAGPAALDSNDWQLVRTCPVPLMLSRGGAWSPHPRFAAAVDVSEEETPGLLQSILRSAAYLSDGCRGELDLVFGERSGAGVATEKAHAAKLRSLAQEVHLGADRVWTLTGDPADTLPAFAAKQHPDVLVLGALTHHARATASVGTLTRKLMDALDCGFVLLRPGQFECPLREPTEEAWAAEAMRDSYSSDPRPAISRSNSYAVLRRCFDTFHGGPLDAHDRRVRGSATAGRGGSGRRCALISALADESAIQRRCSDRIAHGSRDGLPTPASARRTPSSQSGRATVA